MTIKTHNKAISPSTRQQKNAAENVNKHPAKQNLRVDRKRRIQDKRKSITSTILRRKTWQNDLYRDRKRWIQDKRTLIVSITLQERLWVRAWQNVMVINVNKNLEKRHLWVDRKNWFRTRGQSPRPFYRKKVNKSSAKRHLEINQKDRFKIRVLRSVVSTILKENTWTKPRLNDIYGSIVIRKRRMQGQRVGQSSRPFYDPFVGRTDRSANKVRVEGKQTVALLNQMSRQGVR